MLEGRRTNSLCGSFEFIAPEVFSNKDGYDKSTDWWSFGCLLYDMLCGTTPFHSQSKNIVKDNILNKTVGFPDSISVAAKSLIEHLL